MYIGKGAVWKIWMLAMVNCMSEKDQARGTSASLSKPLASRTFRLQDNPQNEVETL